jgi:NADPH:quinone reductase-like Zn-dependent oxidoreductase
MRAVVHDRYGPPEVQRLEDVERPVPNPFHNLAWALVTWKLGNKQLKLALARYRKADVLLLKELIEAGEYRAVIDRAYPVEQIVEATEYVETGEKTGNVVLTVTR